MNLWVFDHDGTLYADRLANAQMQDLAASHVARSLKITVAQGADELRRLKAKWGTKFSLVAWCREHGIGPEEFIYETYLRIDLQACEILSPDHQRGRVLHALDGRKIVFSNSPDIHIRNVLRYAGLCDIFADVIGMEELKYIPKPDPRTFDIVEKRHPGVSRIFFCDNEQVNLDVARDRGWSTILFDPGATDVVRDGHRVVRSFDELLVAC